MLASQNIKPFFSGLSDYWHADCDLINIKFPFGMILYASTNRHSFISRMVVLIVFNQTLIVIIVMHVRAQIAS